MANSISNNQTLEEFRQSYNDLIDEVGGIGSLRTSQKGSVVDAVNSIVDQYFFFQDFEYNGSSASDDPHRTFSGNDNFSNSLNYSVNRLLVFKNGVLLRNGTDYSATNGTSVVLTSGVADGDIIRITSFTGSYEGTASTGSSGSTTQWTRTGAGAIYNHNTSGGVVINSDDSGIVTTPASGVGIQLESDGSDIYLNAGGSSKKVDVNANLSLRSGMKLQKAGGDIAIGDIQGLQAAVRGTLSAGTGISYNSSTGAISASGTADTTGNAATATALQNARTIHGVSFNGTANIDLTEEIQDTVGALISGSGSTTVTYNDGAGTLVVSSTGKTTEEIEDIVGAMFTSTNTETGIAVTYQDDTGDIDLVIGDDAIVGSMIAANTIQGGNIAAATIGSSELAPNSVNASELADDAVDTDAIVNNAVTLGTKTSGNYVGTVAGTSGQIVSSGATSGEGIAHTLSLANSGVSAGSVGSGSAIPVLTIDAKGRITAASTAAVNTYDGFTFGASSSDRGTVDENENIHITGSGAITTSHGESSGTHTLTVSATDASTSAKGIAQFNSDDFTVSSGTVSILHEAVEDIVGAMFHGNGAGATTVTYNDNGASAGTVTISSTDDDTIYTLPLASSSTRGGVKVGYAENGKNYPVELSSEKMYVNVPWSDTNDDTITRLRGGSAAYNTGDITISAGSNVSVSQSGSTITIASTDTNTQLSTADVRGKFSAGTGIGISSGTISVSNAYSPNMNQNVRTTDTVLFGEVRSSGNVTAYYSSDLALKENISPISNALEKVSQIGGYNFDWTDSHIKERGGEDGFFVRKSDVGIIAQEVQKVLPEVVGTRDDGTLGVKYEQIIPLLIESIKELKSEIQSLKS